MYFVNIILITTLFGFCHPSVLPFGLPELWEEARTSHAQLQTEVDQEIISATGTLLAYASTMESNLAIYTTNSTKTINAEHAALVKLVDALKIRAENASVDATVCTAALESRLRKLPDTVTNDITTCMNQRYLQGRDSIDEAILSIQEPNKEVLALSDKIEECSEAIDESGCLNEAIGDIYIKQIGLISGITETTTQTNGLIGIFQNSMLSCTLHRAVIVSNLGNIIVQDMTNCVDRLITTTTTEPITPPTTTPPPPPPPSAQ